MDTPCPALRCSQLAMGLMKVSHIIEMIEGRMPAATYKRASGGKGEIRRALQPLG